MPERKPSPRRRVKLTSNPLSLIGQQAGFYTLQERAEALKISKSHLGHVERGAHLPSPDLVDRMAVAYSRSVEQVERAARLGRENLARRILEHSRGIA